MLMKHQFGRSISSTGMAGTSSSHGADQSEIEAHVRIGVLEAAEAMPVCEPAPCVWNPSNRRRASGRNSFAGGVELGRAAGVNAPATVEQLAAANVVGELSDALRLGLSRTKR